MQNGKYTQHNSELPLNLLKLAKLLKEFQTIEWSASIVVVNLLLFLP